MGDKVDLGDAIAVIHADGSASADHVARRVEEAYAIDDHASPEPLVWRVI